MKWKKCILEYQPVKRLSFLKHTYQVQITIKCTKTFMHPTTYLVDTGGGPSVINDAYSQPPWRAQNSWLAIFKALNSSETFYFHLCSYPDAHPVRRLTSWYMIQLGQYFDSGGTSRNTFYWKVHSREPSRSERRIFPFHLQSTSIECSKNRPEGQKVTQIYRVSQKNLTQFLSHEKNI